MPTISDLEYLAKIMGRFVGDVYTLAPAEVCLGVLCGVVAYCLVKPVLARL